VAAMICRPASPRLMRAANSPDALRATLQFVVSSDMPAEHKVVMIQALTHTLRAEEAEHHRRANQQQPVWQAQETAQLQALLTGRTAQGWQHGDELLMRAAALLHRAPDDIRAKAAELGLSASIDFGQARARARRE
jgi:hypothetical protein